MVQTKGIFRINSIAAQLHGLGNIVIGCSNEEVLFLEKKFQTQFPVVYKHFLLTMGKRSDGFMTGSSFIFDWIEEINEAAIKLLAENEAEAMPPNAFVFFMHQGYSFYFFILGEEEDPSIYYYNEAVEVSTYMRTNFYLSDLLEREAKFIIMKRY